MGNLNPFSKKEEAGYCRPPKETQFAKGKSGNPKGRPKGSKNFVSVLQGVLNQKVTITENGRRRTVTKLEAAMLQLTTKSMSGDLKALHLLAQLIGRIPKPDPSPDPAQTPDQEKDRAVLNSILGAMLVSYGGPPTGNEEQDIS